MRLDDWLGVLRERNFRTYFVGQTASNVGSSMAPVALAFAVLEIPHATASDLGVVLMAGTVPLVVFLLAAGVVADRLGRRRVMLGADVLRGVAEALLAAWILVGRPPLWGFVVLSALVGTGTALFMPASTGLVPEVVSKDRLSQANALSGMSFSLGGVVGPALAGILVAATSPGWAVMVDAVSYAVSVATLVALRLPSTLDERHESFVHQLRLGWTEFWRRTWLWAIVLPASIGNVGLGAFFVLGPVVSKQYLGGARPWGFIMGAEGVGALALGVVMLRLRPRRPLVFALALSCLLPLALLAIGFHRPVALAAAGTFVMGGCLAVFDVQWNTVMQTELPRQLISTLSAYDWFGSLVFLPIGYAVTGPVAAAIGIPATMVAASVYAFVWPLVASALPSVRQVRRHEIVAPSSAG